MKICTADGLRKRFPGNCNLRVPAIPRSDAPALSDVVPHRTLKLQHRPLPDTLTFGIWSQIDECLPRFGQHLTAVRFDRERSEPTSRVIAAKSAARSSLPAQPNVGTSAIARTLATLQVTASTAKVKGV